MGTICRAFGVFLRTFCARWSRRGDSFFLNLILRFYSVILRKGRETRLDGGHDDQRIDGWRRYDLRQLAVGVAAFGYVDEDTVGGVFGPG